MDEREEIKYVLKRLNVNVTHEIPQEIVKFDQGNVEKLKLKGQQITHIPLGLFNRLTQLRELDLKGNYLEQIPSGTFDRLNNLEYLYLNHNHLKSLDGEIFRKLDSLVELHLHHNQLSTLPDELFSGLNNLKALNLSKNNLDSLPTSIKQLEKLEWLDLSMNENLPVEQQRQIILKSRVQQFLRSI